MQNGDDKSNANPLQGVRSGFLTSEFWLTVALIGVLQFDTLSDKLPGVWATAASVLLAFAYKFLRYQLKIVAGDQAVDRAQIAAAAELNRAAKVAVAALAFAALLLSGCATNTGDLVRDRRGRVTNAVLGEAFNAVVKVGLSAGANALAGRNGQDAAGGIFDNVGSIDGAAAIVHVLHAYAGPEIAPVAIVAAQQFQQIAPKTDAERALVVNTIGAAVQSAANQLATR